MLYSEGSYSHSHDSQNTRIKIASRSHYRLIFIRATQKSMWQPTVLSNSLLTIQYYYMDHFHCLLIYRCLNINFSNKKKFKSNLNGEEKKWWKIKASNSLEFCFRSEVHFVQFSLCLLTSNSSFFSWSVSCENCFLSCFCWI